MILIINFSFRKVLFACIFLLGLSQVVSAQHASFEKDSLAIIEVFFDQQTAWNQGDIGAFMEGYWRSTELVFVGAEGPKYGWDQVLADYHIRYPDQAAMGQLKFTVLEVKKLDQRTARQIGKFHLTRAMGNVEGFFTLIWQKIDGKWLIVSDHTSSSD